MSKRNDGGPAFGGAYDEVYVNQNDPEVTAKIERRVRGMSLRDYFAAKAMIALHSSDERGGRWDGKSATICAERSYELADALLAARSK